MLLLRHIEVRPSPIHGLGIFTTEPIKKGTSVSGWKAGFDFVLTSTEWLELPHLLRDFLYTFCWRGENGRWYGSSDNARFTNHSKTPNLKWDERSRTSIAARDIAAGEELTEDYQEFDDAFSEYADEVIQWAG